jgi:serine protease Do
MSSITRFPAGLRRPPFIVMAAAASLAFLVGSQINTPVLAKTAPANAGFSQTEVSRGSFADLVEAVAPAVVNITSKAGAGGPAGASPQFQLPPGSPFKDFFERYFEERGHRGPSDMPHQPAQAQGSGFIIDPDGYVVTNHHVVKGAEEITVITNDGAEYAASLKGFDGKTDLAVLKIESTEPLPYVEFGDSDRARVGDWVVAIGNPFGLGGTATTGIISARGRDIRSGPLDDFLQIDAPINRGNSGGPLFSADGRVVGVNTAIFSPNGGNVGIGFAIPASMAQSVVDQLITNGNVERGWLGVQIQSVSEEIAASLDLEAEQGALVASVVGDSPAAAADLQPGDVILEYDGQTVREMRELPRMVAATAAGSDVQVKLWRGGKAHTKTVTVGRSEESAQLAEAADEPAPERAPARLGLALAPLTPESRAQYGVGAEVSGALVVEVRPGSPAAAKGLRPGDIIKMVGGTRVEAPDDVRTEVNRAVEQAKSAVLLLVTRDGNDRFVAVKVA